jgi:hypothetical protein
MFKKKIEEIKRTVNFIRRDITTFVVFLVLVALVFIAITYFKDYVAPVGYTILFIELVILVMAAWTLAGHAVMKSLFLVGASLSLIIFLAQSYCEAPNLTQSGNDALKTLLAFGFLYITFDFLRSLYKEIIARSKTLQHANDGKRPWLFLIPFALFVGIFIWQIVQVLMPILQNLCIYH